MLFDRKLAKLYNDFSLLGCIKKSTWLLRLSTILIGQLPISSPLFKINWAQKEILIVTWPLNNSGSEEDDEDDDSERRTKRNIFDNVEDNLDCDLEGGGGEGISSKEMMLIKKGKTALAANRKAAKALSKMRKLKKR